MSRLRHDVVGRRTKARTSKQIDGAYVAGLGGMDDDHVHGVVMRTIGGTEVRGVRRRPNREAVVRGQGKRGSALADEALPITGTAAARARIKIRWRSARLLSNRIMGKPFTRLTSSTLLRPHSMRCGPVAVSMHCEPVKTARRGATLETTTYAPITSAIQQSLPVEQSDSCHPRLRSLHCRSDFRVGRRCPSRYTAQGGPDQVVSASASPTLVWSPTQATCPSGRISTAVGAVTAPSTGNSHAPTHLASIS